MLLLVILVGMYIGAGLGSLFTYNKVREYMYGEEIEPLPLETKLKFVFFWFNLHVTSK